VGIGRRCWFRGREPASLLGWHEGLLWGQLVEVYTAVVVGHVDLAAVDYGRIEFVEEELNAPALRVPEDVQVTVRSKVHGIVDEKAAPYDIAVGVSVGDGADEDS